jgi:hypothetical protein
MSPTQLPPDTIIAYCARYLATFKLPRYIEYVTEFPRTPSRKIKKAALLASKPDLRTDSFDAVDKIIKRRPPQELSEALLNADRRCTTFHKWQGARTVGPTTHD